MTAAPKPVRGEHFERAVRASSAPDFGGKRRRTYCLIAGWHDAGLRRVGVWRLAPILGLPEPIVHALCQRLEADGLLASSKRGGRRRYRIPAETTP